MAQHFILFTQYIFVAQARFSQIQGSNLGHLILYIIKTLMKTLFITGMRQSSIHA